MDDFFDLECWKESRKFRLQMTIVTKKFPPEEKFRLTDQLIRSSRSITANLAEGHGKFHYQESIQYCRNARGSLKESLDHLICAYDEKYISEAELSKYKNMYSLCLKLINGYTAYLKKRKSEE
jgi:four helix bundle protein